MNVIVISGGVGCGKTTVAKKLADELKYELIPLSKWAEEFKLKDVNELQTFDFDIEKLINKVHNYLGKNKKDVIFESHFAHYIDPKFVTKLFVMDRDISEVKKEYEKRGYNKQKIDDNIEACAMNICFYEAIEEGYEEEKQVFCVENKDLDETIKKIREKLK